MFKLVVLFAFVAIAAAKPGFLHAPLVSVPAAVSHTSRVDVYSKPVIATYAAPIVEKTVVAAPAVYAAPVVAAPIIEKAILPAAVSHQYRSDVIQSHAVVAPVVAHELPAVHAW